MKPEKFELKAEHLRLLQHCNLQMQNCETGAPEIDPKRPYGNSAVAEDVAEILGIMDTPEYDTSEYADWQSEMLEWHYQTLWALQIILSRKEVKLGWYRPIQPKKSDLYRFFLWEVCPWTLEQIYELVDSLIGMTRREREEHLDKINVYPIIKENIHGCYRNGQLDLISREKGAEIRCPVCAADGSYGSFKYFEECETCNGRGYLKYPPRL